MVSDMNLFVIYFQGFSQIQLEAVEENTFVVQEREKEITQIVKSISDLNDIFKDLAAMIVDQVCFQLILVNDLFSGFQALILAHSL